MVVIGLTFAAAVAVTASIVLALRHRRLGRAPILSSHLDPLPAGLKHLAASVGDLSDLGLHLPSATRAFAQRRRLGVLLGLR